jgi:hypothetical protein
MAAINGPLSLDEHAAGKAEISAQEPTVVAKLCKPGVRDRLLPCLILHEQENENIA